MPLGTSFAHQLVLFFFNGIPIPGLADLAVSSPITSLWCALHTADPKAGDQTLYEANHGGYARKELVIGAGVFTVTDNVANLVSPVVFADSTGVGGNYTHASIGTQQSGAGLIIMTGLLSVPINVVQAGIIPQIKTDTTFTWT